MASNNISVLFPSSAIAFSPLILKIFKYGEIYESFNGYIIARYLAAFNTHSIGKRRSGAQGEKRKMAVQKVQLIFGPQKIRVVSVRVGGGRADIGTVGRELGPGERFLGTIGHCKWISPQRAIEILKQRGKEISAEAVLCGAIGLKTIMRGDERFDEILQKSYFPSAYLPRGDVSGIKKVAPLLTIGQFKKLAELSPAEMARIVPEYKGRLKQAEKTAEGKGFSGDNSPMTSLKIHEMKSIAELLGMPEIYVGGAWGVINTGSLRHCCYSFLVDRGDIGVGFAERT